MATSLPDIDRRLRPSQVFELLSHEHFQPDPQFAVPKVAEVLDVTPKAVRGYLKLVTTAPHHPRRLPYVDTTGTPRGYRVPLSELNAWQQRNRPDVMPLEIPVNRPARRRAA